MYFRARIHPRETCRNNFATVESWNTGHLERFNGCCLFSTYPRVHSRCPRESHLPLPSTSFSFSFSQATNSFSKCHIPVTMSLRPLWCLVGYFSMSFKSRMPRDPLYVIFLFQTLHGHSSRLSFPHSSRHSRIRILSLFLEYKILMTFDSQLSKTVPRFI